MEFKLRWMILALVVGWWLHPAPTVAATLSGEVRSSSDDAPIAGAMLVIEELGRSATTDGPGKFEFTGVAPGTYHLAVTSGRFNSKREEVKVTEEVAAPLTVVLVPRRHEFEVVVTGTPTPKDPFETYQPVESLAGEDLQKALDVSLGETLSKQAGIAAESLGAATARPVIRGLSGDRVLVLQDGARVGDLSDISPDHAVPIDAASAQRIEIVRGPATLLYGSNAIGGVVNVIDEDYRDPPAEGVSGTATFQAGSAYREAAGAGAVRYVQGPWVFRGVASGRDAGNVHTPEGEIQNTRQTDSQGGFALAWTDARGFLEGAYSYSDLEYGVPLEEEEGEALGIEQQQAEEGGITLTPRRHWTRIRGELRDLGGLEAVRFHASFTRYRHDEVEASGEIGTAFSNDQDEFQGQLRHRPIAGLRGTFGAWGARQDFSALGEEALAPPTKRDAAALFGFEEWRRGHLGLQVGGRWEHTSYDVDSILVAGRTFDGFSGSISGLWFFTEDVLLAASFTRAYRNPSIEELYNNGPHPATASFEVGNPNLDAEIGHGFDVSLRWRQNRVSGEVSFFRNAIDRFIFGFPTGEIEDGLPVFAFIQADSVLTGFELHADVLLTEGLWLEVGADAVRGAITADDEPLPRIPPRRGWLGLEYERSGWRAGGEVRWAAEQDRVFGFETPTDGYTLAALHGGYSFATGAVLNQLTVRLDNATDELYRNHLSRIKELVPEAGRSVRLIYRVDY